MSQRTKNNARIFKNKNGAAEPIEDDRFAATHTHMGVYTCDRRTAPQTGTKIMRVDGVAFSDDDILCKYIHRIYACNTIIMCGVYALCAVSWRCSGAEPRDGAQSARVSAHIFHLIRRCRIFTNLLATK